MIRAYIHDSYMAGDLAVSILNEFEPDPGQQPARLILRLGDNGANPSWEPLDYSLTGPKPTLTLGHAAAHALLAALTNHYQGVDDQRMLRKDYDDERKRVDGLIHVLTDVARGAVANGGGRG
jgi:hypothetical protein